MNAVATVENYLARMKEWESKHRARTRSEQYKSDDCYRESQKVESKKELLDIFQEFVEDGAKNRLSESRLSILAVSSPSEFNQVIINGEETSNQAIIYTKQLDGFEEHFRFTLKSASSQGEWRISKLAVSLDGVQWEARRSL